jgi:hypothetical protein
VHLFKLVCKETNFSYIFALRKGNKKLNSKIHRGVEQSVARWAHNPKVAGSSPVPATTSLQRKLEAFFMRKKWEVVVVSLLVVNSLMDGGIGFTG